jgi:hypothetical protein
MVSSNTTWVTGAPTTTVSGVHPCMAPRGRILYPAVCAQLTIATTSAAVFSAQVHTASSLISSDQFA